jgi:hypothetical protein
VRKLNPSRYLHSRISEMTGELVMDCLVSHKDLFNTVELSQVAISSKLKAAKARFNLSREIDSICFINNSKVSVSVWSWVTGNKKYNSSEPSPISEKLLTNFGINLSTELSVLPATKLHLKEDSLNEYSGLIKLLNSKFEFFESP